MEYGIRLQPLAILTNYFRFSEIQLQWADTRSLSLFMSSCDSQKLRYFTLSPEHKGRVLVQEFQYLRF